MKGYQIERILVWYVSGGEGVSEALEEPEWLVGPEED